MKSAPVRYGTRFGCRWGQPHNMKLLHESKVVKVERCLICGYRGRYPKDSKGRTDNVKYLKDHVRQFAQRHGSTKRVHARLYSPEKTIIRLSA